MRSASKNSGDIRWPCRFSSLISSLAIRAAPESRPSASEASKSLTVPPKLPMPMYWTSNATDE